MPVNMTGFAGKGSRQKRTSTTLKPAIFKMLEPSLKERDGRLGQLRFPLKGITKHRGFSSESAEKTTYCYQTSQPANVLGKRAQL